MSVDQRGKKPTAPAPAPVVTEEELNADLLRALNRAAVDFDIHLGELTAQLPAKNQKALEEALELIEQLWAGDRPGQLNVCKWLTYKVRLGEVDDLADQVQRVVDFGRAGV